MISTKEEILISDEGIIFSDYEEQSLGLINQLFCR